MRSLFLLLNCLFVFTGYSQEKNSLLWEISGNGLEQSSYLYGTMHVSKKIAFRLDDVFYEALDSSEMVALESDPGLWLENSDKMGGGSFGYGGGYVTKGFYARNFKVENPKKELLGAYLAYEDRVINNILYRTNEFSQNFEEETYLDMFIYQAGKKFDKPIVALEDMEESSALVGRASMNAMKQKPDEWLQKKMQRSDPMFLLQDAYRERNISLLDSIDRAMYTEHYMKNMLYIRNANMAKRLDSVMHQGKVFAGIGAAHLPGGKGVINLLRKEGYTVTPLTSKSSVKGKTIKLKFEQKKRENEYKAYGPEDGFFTINLPNKLYPVSDLGKTTYVSPDLANGSFVVINRVPTHSFLKQDEVYTLEDIDKLLFENIPGKIEEKNAIEKNGFKGLDIKNQLKNGDRQRYQIFKTPLEILIIKMGGEGDYVTEHSDNVFNSLAFRKPEAAPVRLASNFDDFQVDMPALYSFTNKSRNGGRWIEGYDEKQASYYFLRKSVLNDFGFIETDTFELKQIQKRFYQDLKLTPRYREIDGKKLISSAIFDSDSGKRLHLMTTIRSGEYYLLGVLTAYGKEAEEYFDSFQLKATKYGAPFETVVDTALYFTTKSTVNPPKFVESSTSYFSGAPETKPYNPFHKKTVYRNRNDEAITVELNKSHDFLMFSSLDSAWALRKKLYAHKQFNVMNEQRQTTPEGYQEMQLTLTDTASTRGILIKNIIKNGLLYELKAIVDTVESPSRFITEFFENFTPEDTIIGRDILEDKVPDFFAALRKNDSIVLDGHRYLKFDKSHVDSLENYIYSHKFSPAMQQIQSYMILQLGQLEGVDATDFYRDFYAKSYNNSTAQAMVLQSISQKSDEASVALLLELMATDLPLLSNTFHISYIFAPYRENLSLAKKLFPELLQYSTISEYKAPIFSLLAKLVAAGELKPNNYKKYKSQILNDAKIQLKRQLGRDISQNTQDFYSPITPQQNRGVLEDYVTLLYPFHKEKRVQQFFQKIALIEDPDIRTTYVSVLIKNEQYVPERELLDLAADLNTRQLLYKKLEKIGALKLFPEKFKTQKDLAEAQLFSSGSFVSTRDEVHCITKQPIPYNGKDFTGYYFKKRSNEDYDTNYTMHLLVFEDDKGLQTEPFYENGGMRIEDTDSDEDVIGFVTEEFLLKDRQRAEVYRPNGYGGGYGHHGF